MNTGTPPLQVSATAARAWAIAAQGLSQDAGLHSVSQLLKHLGAIQLDTISVLARSHELVPRARIDHLSTTAIHDAFWGTGPARNDAHCFEYWPHAACLLPIESWPLFAFRRRKYANESEDSTWHGLTLGQTRGERSAVLKVLASEGPMTATELGGAKRPGDWWSWSERKIALEQLLAFGEVVCTRRIGWRRVYDLPERALPASVLAADRLSDEECIVALIRDAARTLGVGTVKDIADVHRLAVTQVKNHAKDAGLVPVHVEGWPQSWAHPEALSFKEVSSRTVALSPFDSLVWCRERTERVFGMFHRLEAYTPAEKRIHGYFAMPVLHNNELVARIDPARRNSTLVIKRTTFESHTAENVTAVAQALTNAAEWVGSQAIEIEVVTPARARKPLLDAIKQSSTSLRVLP